MYCKHTHSSSISIGTRVAWNRTEKARKKKIKRRTTTLPPSFTAQQFTVLATFEKWERSKNNNKIKQEVEVEKEEEQQQKIQLKTGFQIDQECCLLLPPIPHLSLDHYPMNKSRINEYEKNNNNNNKKKKYKDFGTLNKFDLECMARRASFGFGVWLDAPAVASCTQIQVRAHRTIFEYIWLGMNNRIFSSNWSARIAWHGPNTTGNFGHDKSTLPFALSFGVHQQQQSNWL